MSGDLIHAPEPSLHAGIEMIEQFIARQRDRWQHELANMQGPKFNDAAVRRALRDSEVVLAACQVMRHTWSENEQKTAQAFARLRDAIATNTLITEAESRGP